MIVYNINISKSRVLDEVAKTTAYIGSKAVSADDPGAYERVATTDANREQLERYWMEACSGASLLLDHWLVSVSSHVLTHHPELDKDYKVSLSMTTNWQSQYLSTLQEALMSYMVNSIVTKWLLVALPSQAETYAALESGAAGQVSQIVLLRKRPGRRRSDGGEGAMWVSTESWERNEQWQYN